MRRYLQIIVQEDVINQLYHPLANPSTLILAKDYIMLVYVCHTTYIILEFIFTMSSSNFETIHQNPLPPIRLGSLGTCPVRPVVSAALLTKGNHLLCIVYSFALIGGLPQSYNYDLTMSSPIGCLLPSTKETGRGALSLVNYLAVTHNEIVAERRRVQGDQTKYVTKYFIFTLYIISYTKCLSLMSSWQQKKSPILSAFGSTHSSNCFLFKVICFYVNLIIN